MRALRPLSSILLLAATLPAQRTVIVDVNNGPGTWHTTLAGALASVQDGDLIIVRAGDYVGTSVSTLHSFALVGEGGPIIRPAPATASTLRITLSSNLQHVALRGLTIYSETTGQWALDVRSNFNGWPAPTVHVEDCTIRSLSTLNDQVGLQATSVGLTLQRCTASTVQVIASAVSIVESTLQGADARITTGFAQRPLTALDVLRSQVWVCDSTLRAGASMALNVQPASALAIVDEIFRPPSHVALCGTTTVIADPSPGAGWPAPPVVVNYTSWLPSTPTLDHEPGVTLVPAPGGVLFGPAIVVGQRTIAWLAAGAATPGANLELRVHGAPGDTAAAVFGLATFPQSVLGAPVFLNLAGALTAGIATLPGNGESLFAVPVPNLPVLRGLLVAATGVTADATGAISLTNPAAAVLD
ncbi:MAG: hypothetical protein IPM29_11490 [Planctomycetes bacterium]|nr:hypothetical protein [Planctomycetota bacterium]